MSLPHVEINGRLATPAQLLAATSSYGHFTSLQVRDGKVAGWSLHVRRLVDATRTLFGSELDEALLREWLARGLQRAQLRSASVRVVVYASGFDRERPEAPQEVDVMITLTASQLPRATPLRVQLQVYERDLPAIKHLSTFGLFWQRRLARLAGFDDALFCTREAAISEGSVWNVGFWDGERLIWPQAPMLDGVAQQLLKAGLQQLGVASETRMLGRADLPTMRAAFACNSSGSGRPILAIDDQQYTWPNELERLLQRAIASIPPDAVMP